MKEALQAEVGLPVDRNIPMICFLGRLEEQKGPDILVAAIDQFIDEGVQIIILVSVSLIGFFCHIAVTVTRIKLILLMEYFYQGTGKKYLEKMIEGTEKKYPDKVRAIAKFNVPLAHVMISGSDFILIPSRFEPCGLIQLQAMRYGTVRL